MTTALDLFCGGGGAAQGMLDAGFDRVVGVDTNRRCGKVYPGEFIQGDACNPPVDLADFDFVWASPPCQAYSKGTGYHERKRRKHLDLVAPIRELLSGHPLTCMENVPGAPMRPDLRLTGPMVGLPRILRLRYFELSFFILQPDIQKPPKSDWERGYCASISTSMSATSHYYRRKRAGLSGRIPVVEAREIMGIRHKMTGHQVGNAVAPPMAEFIAAHALRSLGGNITTWQEPAGPATLSSDRS